MQPNLQFSADLITFTEEILNENLYFLCSLWERGKGILSPQLTVCRAISLYIIYISESGVRVTVTVTESRVLEKMDSKSLDYSPKM